MGTITIKNLSSVKDEIVLHIISNRLNHFEDLSKQQEREINIEIKNRKNSNTYTAVDRE